MPTNCAPWPGNMKETLVEKSAKSSSLADKAVSADADRAALPTAARPALGANAAHRRDANAARRRRDMDA